MSLKKDILWRVAVVYLAVLMLGALIIGRVVYLQFFEADKWKQQSKEAAYKNVTVEADRGTIRAADGRPLAISVPYYEVRVDFLSNALDQSLLTRKIDSLSLCLSNLFNDHSPYQYKQALLDARKRKNRFYLLKRNVTYEQLKKLKTFPVFRRGQFKGGFISIKEDKRVKPYGILAARTIGYTTKSGIGSIVGIEGAFDHHLKGVEGMRLMRRVPGGVWIPVSDENEIDPKDGKDVITTIDVNLQDVAESALHRQLVRHDAQFGTAVLMEVETGHVKAISNLKKVGENNYGEVFNFAVGQSIEPGSTFKLPALMTAIEDGFVDLDDTVDTGNGRTKYYNHVVEDTEEGGHGVLTVKEILEVSSNIGVSKIIDRYYKDRPHRFVDRLYSMNLNEPLGLRIKGEGDPDIKYPGEKYWSGLSLPMISFGYEVRLTPLQILSFYNAVANNGRMVKPLFVTEIRKHGEVYEKIDVDVLNSSICSFSTIKKARSMLEGVVQNGTAQNLRNANYKIAGKTGTAQIANDKYGYAVDSKISYMASFVGYFPADNPAYSCIVMVSAPSRNVYYGNLVAGPVFKEIADKVYASSPELQKPVAEIKKLESVDPPYTKTGDFNELKLVLDQFDLNYRSKDVTSDWVVSNKHEKHVDLLNLNVMDDFVPNVKGMGLKDAVFLLENAGLDVLVNGRGTVKDQSITPGARVEKGARVQLTMSIM